MLNETTQPTTFNPQVPNNVSTSVLLTRLLTPLVTFDPSSQTYEPALARSWEIGKDNKSYTFHLRRGVLWSDGVEIVRMSLLLATEADGIDGTRP